MLQQLKQPQCWHGAGVLAHQHLPWSHPQRQRVAGQHQHEHDHHGGHQGPGGEPQAGQGPLEGSPAAIYRPPHGRHSRAATGHLSASHGIHCLLLPLCWQVWSLPRPLLWQGVQEKMARKNRIKLVFLCRNLTRARDFVPGCSYPYSWSLSHSGAPVLSWQISTNTMAWLSSQTR